MTNRNESYLATARTRLDRDFWNAVVRDVGARLSSVEAFGTRLDALADLARQLAVQRVNEALATYVTMIEGVAEIGALTTVVATGEAQIGPGEKTLIVNLPDRDLIGNEGYVVVRPFGSTTARMSGPIVGYSAASGELRFEVMNAVGDGTDNTWVVGYAKTVVEGPVGPAPGHAWDGTKLHFKNPDGSWGSLVDLIGPPGPTGGLEEASRATQTEAEAGANNAKWMSPLRVKQAIVELAPAPDLSDYYTKTGTDGAISTALGNYYTQAQVTAAITAAVNSLVDGAPGALNTLNELAAALNDNASFATTVTNALAAKLESVAFANIDSAALATWQNYVAASASKLLTADKVWDGVNFVGITDAGTIALDMSAAINMFCAISGNRTLGNPTNLKRGQAGCIAVNASGGARTLSKSSTIKSNDNILWPVEIPSGQSAYVFYFAYNTSNFLITHVMIAPD